MRKSILLLSLCSAAILAGCGQKTSAPITAPAVIPAPKPVVRTINAGFISYAPGFIVDPNTNVKSGITYEVLEEIAKRKNLKVNYTTEAAWGTMIELLDANRVDIMANPVWMTESRIGKVEFSTPVYYSPIGTYVRPGQTKVTSLSGINLPSVKIAAVDWEGGQQIAKTLFSNANLISFPVGTDVSQMLLEVALGKEDVTFAEPIFAYEYIKNNPGKLLNIAETTPVQKWANSFMMKKGNTELQAIINQGINELVADGTLDKILNKYEPFPHAVIRVTK
jgi:polar amino acid transport system substrate-binding protein